MTIDFNTLNARNDQEDMYLIEFEYATSTLSASAASGASAIWADDIGDFPNLGFAQIGAEIFQYDLKTFDPASAAAPGWFRVTRRGCFGTEAASAASGATVREPWLDKRFCTSASHADLASDWPYLKIPKGNTQSIKPGEGQSTIGTMDFELTDVDDTFSKIAATVPLRNRRITFKGGFAELPAANWETEWVGLVRNVQLDSKHLSWKIQCADTKRYMRKELFTQLGQSKLSASATAAATSFSVDSTDGTAQGDVEFVDPATYEYDVYVRIGEEIIGPVTSMTGTTLVCGAGCRGKFNTIAATHAIDDDVNQHFLVGAVNPVTLALQLLTSTGDGTNGAYDVLPESQGMAVLAANVDVAGFEAERDTWLTDTNVAFYVTKEESDGKVWIEKNILRMVNATISANRDGTLRFKISNPPIPGVSPESLTTSNIIGLPSFSASLEGIQNQIKLEYSADPFDAEFIQTLLTVDADSISRHDDSPVLEIPLPGVHGSKSLVADLDGDELAASVAKWYRSRFSEPVPEIKLKTFMKNRQIEVGDMVAVTFDSLPNWRPSSDATLTGRGLDALVFEVISKTTNFDKAVVDLTLLGTTFSWRKFGVIGATGTPDYTSASAIQKNYGFICDPNTHEQSDGDIGCRIWAGGGGATDSDLLFLEFLTSTLFAAFKAADDTIYARWNATTGHTHDGSADGGAPITSLPESATFEQDLTVTGCALAYCPENPARCV